MTNTQTKALIYCRVSDPKQKIEGSGLKSQEHRCRQHAEEKGYFIDGVFHDDITGGGDFAKRPGMTALLNRLKRNSSTQYVVIFDDLKRFARDTLFHLSLRNAMNEYGVRRECLNYKFDDSPEGQFIETLFAAQGQLEREQNGRQTRQKTKARLEAGYYPFKAPVGFKYADVKPHGKLLKVDEAVRPVLVEALEGFASGRFQTKAEVRHLFEASPEYPKPASGKIANARESIILSCPLYAGYLEYKPWGVNLRKAQHEAIISFETFQKIQERLKGRAYAPARADINEAFPLRGTVACECGNSLTSCYSKSCTGRRYPYYICRNRKCEYKGKSIPKAKLEGEFEALLKTLTPSQSLFDAANAMFKTLWKQRESSQQKRQALLKQQISKIDRDIEQALDRIVAAESATVIKAFEKRITDSENAKLVLEEKLVNSTQPIRSYEQMYRTAFDFLQKPYKIWASGTFADKRAVLKLAFTDRITYVRNEGYRTPALSLPFKVLGGDLGEKMQMVPAPRVELGTY